MEGQEWQRKLCRRQLQLPSRVIAEEMENNGQKKEVFFGGVGEQDIRWCSDVGNKRELKMTEIFGLSNQVTGGNIHWDVGDIQVGRVGSSVMLVSWIQCIQEITRLERQLDFFGGGARPYDWDPLTMCVCLHLNCTLKTKEMDEII